MFGAAENGAGFEFQFPPAPTPIPCAGFSILGATKDGKPVPDMALDASGRRSAVKGGGGGDELYEVL